MAMNNPKLASRQATCVKISPKYQNGYGITTLSLEYMQNMAKGGFEMPARLVSLL